MRARNGRKHLGNLITKAHPVESDKPQWEARLALLVCLACVSVPYLFVHFPPATDIPQHVAQGRLLAEALSGAHPELKVGWLSPNTLVYLPLLLLYAAVPPVLAGKLLLLLLSYCWVAGIFLITGHLQRPVANAVLACCLVFSCSLYWGFANFLTGLPVFALWLVALTPRARSAEPPGALTLRQGVVLALLATMLYLAHILWLLFGLLYLGFVCLRQGFSLRQIAWRVVPLLPVLVLTALWYPGMHEYRSLTGYEVGAQYVSSPLDRVMPWYVVDYMLGGLKGPLPAIATTLLLVWMGLAAILHRRSREGLDWWLVAPGCFLALVALLAPDKYLNTILFNSRWAPIATLLLLLGLPLPPMRRKWALGVALAGLVAFCGTTAAVWHTWERTELVGLREALDAASAGKLLALDVAADSRYLTGRPFMQMGAYAQAEKGADLWFSFAEHGSSLVAYHPPRQVSWRRGLEWHPEAVRLQDLLQFEQVLLHLSTAQQAEYVKGLPLRPLSPPAPWRLYQVIGAEGPH